MNKDYYRIYLTKYERDISVLFYEQLMFKLPKIKYINSSKAKLLNIARRLKLDKDIINTIWERTFGAYKTMSIKVAYKRTLQDRDKILRQNLPNLNIYELLNNIEANIKTKQWEKNLANPSPFYLCSEHGEPLACGHKDYQGKVYINQNWRDKVQDNPTRKKIEAYIHNHKLRNVEWVISDPVWLTTRPNCKHYLIPIPIDDVLTKSAKKLLAIFQKKQNNFKINVQNYKKNNQKYLDKMLKSVLKRHGVKL